MAMLSRTSAVFLLFFLSQMPYMLALSLSGRYAQFAQLFGLPSTLPNISLASAGVSEECFDAVTKLNASTLAYCEYERVFFKMKLFVKSKWNFSAVYTGKRITHLPSYNAGLT